MKKLFLLAFVAITAISCSKKDDDPQKDEDVKVAYYPLSIKYKPAYNPTIEYVYTFEYDANNRLSSYRIKDTKDSLYNKIVYNDKGQITKMGTAKEANALVFEYNTAGQVTKFTENRAPFNGVAQNIVYTYEYDAQGAMTKYTQKHSSSSQTTTYVFAYKNGNVETLQQQTYNPDYTYGYTSNINGLYGNEVLNFLRCLSYEQISVWGGAQIIFNSKNELANRRHRQPGEDQSAFTYEYDSQKRPIKVTQTDENSKAVRATWELTWK